VTWMSINVREIPRSQWPAFFDQFSRTHRAWLAELTTGEPTPDTDRAGASTRPLRSITPFVHNDRVVHIDIRFQDDEPGHEPLRIHAPVSARVEETTEGTAQELAIVDAKGNSIHLRFRGWGPRGPA